ncbi:MAG: fasciclin domain-containing protein [Acidimicrobiia bacterium]|nr:fasciclin domain-containing protein [Acidimicrobiia bacterium]
MDKKLLSLLAALFALTLVAAACGDDATEAEASESTEETTEETTAADEAMEDDAMAEEDAMDEPGTIVDVAVANGSFTTLVAAVQAAGLDTTLSGDGPFTVFAPTDDAFVAALDALGLTAEELLADTATLESILTYHVVAGEVPSSDVVTMDGQSVATVNGAEMTISVDGDTVMVNDATVTAVDVEASNGVIHVIDSVLLPPAG